MKSITFAILAIILASILCSNDTQIDCSRILFNSTNSNEFQRNFTSFSNEDNEFVAPFQVAIYYKNIHYCAGSFISPRTVITASICIIGKQVSDFSIRYGTNDLKIAPYPDLSVSRIIKHENDILSPNNIALLILESPIIPNDYDVGVIEIEKESPPDGSPISLYRWDKFGTRGLLLRDNLKVKNIFECSQIWNSFKLGQYHRQYEFIEHYPVICVSKPTKTCKGDAGGPLVSANNRLVGIMLHDLCFQDYLPELCLNTAYFVDWIEENMVY